MDLNNVLTLTLNWDFVQIDLVVGYIVEVLNLQNVTHYRTFIWYIEILFYLKKTLL